MADYLQSITVRFPGPRPGFTDRLAALLETLGRSQNSLLVLSRSDPAFYPAVLLDFAASSPGVTADFTLSGAGTFSVEILNTTGLTKASPYTYRHLSLETAIRRLETSRISLVGLDHVGFNLPWFTAPGSPEDVHPTILQVREKISSRCLYHTYPTGEPWDFILPGDLDEIAHRKPVDYATVRRPKFELVSFENASTPLIQLDLGVDASYETFSHLFPEALDDPTFRNIWLYLKSPYPVDVCLVLNEFAGPDWSDYFADSRL